MADQVQAAATPTEPMSKVFVGNLAFRTTDQDLQTLFKECGEIKAGVIITRGRRSLGYGFIEFVKPDDAAACVDVMNKKEFLGRPLKVELAKDPSERPDRLERTGHDEQDQDAPRPQRVRKAPNPQADVKDSAPVTTQTQVPGAKPKRQRKPRNPDQAPVQPQVVPPPVAVDEKGPSTRRPTRPKKAKKPRSPGAPGEHVAPVVTHAPAAPANAEPKPPKKKREPKEPRPQPSSAEKVNSKTTLFVANLPFTIDDETLAAVFTGYNVKSAHVVRTYNNRSRGYGFVEFESETDQVKALAEKNNALVPSKTGDPRAISISISSSNGSAPEQQQQTSPQ